MLLKDDFSNWQSQVVRRHLVIMIYGNVKCEILNVIKSNWVWRWAYHMFNLHSAFNMLQLAENCIKFDVQFQDNKYLMAIKLTLLRLKWS